MSKPVIPLSSLSLLMRLTPLLLIFGYVAMQLYIATHMMREGTAWVMLLVLPGLIPVLLPYAFYCAAMWTAGNVFDRMAKDKTLTPVITNGLKSMGWHLVRGAIAAIVISATVAAWLEGRRTGAFWNHYVFPVESLTIGLIGLALIALSTQARRLHAELEQFI